MDGNATAGPKARTGNDELSSNKPADLSKFQVRILAVLAADDDAPKGVTIKRRLRAYYEKEINHGRLYPNLDDLVDEGFITKGEKDARTNAYALTDAGRAALHSELMWIIDRVDSFQVTETTLPPTEADGE